MKKVLLSLLFLAPLALAGVPYELIATGSYRDGGTVWAKLKSSSGETSEMCIDRRIKSETSLEMFIGATYPTKKEAQIATEADRSKLVFMLKELTSSEPEKHATFIEVLKEHEEFKKSEPAGTGQPM